MFRFRLGGIQWTISLAMSVPLSSAEVLTLENEDLHRAQTYVSVDVHSGERHVLDLKGGYRFALERRRLDIFTGKKQNTFICLKEDENHRVPIMSVALDRFRSTLPRDYQTRLRREQFLQMEVFCGYERSDPGQNIRKMEPGKSPWSSDTDTNASKKTVSAMDNEERPAFTSRDGDFPSLHCGPDDLISDFESYLLKVHERMEKGQLQNSHVEEMHDRMISLTIRSCISST